MGNMGKWVAGVLGGLVALIGLFFAASATDNGAYYGGLVIFLVGIAFIFYQLKRGLDAAESHWQQGRATGATSGGGTSGGSKSGGSKSGGTKSGGAKASAASGGGKSATAKSAGSTSGGKSARPGSNGAKATKRSGG